MSEEKSLSDWFNKGNAAVVEGEKKVDAPADEDVSAKYARFKDFDLPEFEEILTLVQGATGEDVASKIKAFTGNYAQASKVAELETENAKREDWFRKNQIVHSQEFQEKYALPVAKSLDLYSALMSEVDKDGNYKNENVYEKLRKSIWDDGNEMPTPKIKALLKEFSKQYTDKFGVEPDLPSIKAVIDARDDLINASKKKNNALEQWEQLREVETAQEKAKQLDHQSNVVKNTVAENKSKFATFKQQLQPADFAFVPQADFEAIVDTFEKSFIGMIDGSIKRQPEDYLPEGLKAQAYDRLLTEYQTLRKYVDDKLGGGPKVKGAPPAQDQGKKEEKAGSLSEFFGF